MIVCNILHLLCDIYWFPTLSVFQRPYTRVGLQERLILHCD